MSSYLNRTYIHHICKHGLEWKGGMYPSVHLLRWTGTVLGERACVNSRREALGAAGRQAAHAEIYEA